MNLRLPALNLMILLSFGLSACSNGPVGNMGLTVEELPSSGDTDPNSQTPTTTPSTTTTTTPSTTTTTPSTTTTVPSTTTTTVAGCQNFTTQQSSLVVGLNTCGATAMAKPALNIPYIDPRYGTKITRVTDVSQITTQVPAWVRHEYSRKPAFNSDSTRATMISSNGWIRLYSVDKAANTMSFVKTLNLAENQESIWHPTNPNLLYHLGQYGLGMKIYSYDVTTDISTDLTPTLPAQIQARFPTAGLAWFKQEGRPSDDGKIWCLQVETSGFQMLGLISFNLETGNIIGHLANTTRPDHTSTSPDGTRCIPSWAFNPTLGTRSYSLDFSSHIMLHTQSEHSDMAITESGRNVLVTFDYNSGDIAMIDAHNGARTNLMRLYGPNSSGVAGHVSGIGSTGRPGYAVVSFYGCTENYGAQSCTDAQWFKNKVVVVELKANPKIYNVAHTQFGGGGYWGETQATVNKDLTKILFVSTWRADQENQLASYMIDIPPALLP